MIGVKATSFYETEGRYEQEQDNLWQDQAEQQR